jgi:hypothetical protein
MLGVAVVSVVALAVALAPIYPYRPYRTLNPNDGWTPCDKWLTPEHCDRLVILLDRYGELHLRVGRRLVLIPLKLKLDREETGNYSQKAEPERKRAFMRNIVESQGRPLSDFQ